MKRLRSIFVLIALASFLTGTLALAAWIRSYVVCDTIVMPRSAGFQIVQVVDGLMVVGQTAARPLNPRLHYEQLPVPSGDAAVELVHGRMWTEPVVGVHRSDHLELVIPTWAILIVGWGISAFCISILRTYRWRR